MIAVFLRLLARRLGKVKILADDYMMIFALVSQRELDPLSITSQGIWIMRSANNFPSGHMHGSGRCLYLL